MKRPTTAILDGDIIAYRSAFWADAEGVEDLPYRIKNDIGKWTPRDIDNVIVAMSCPRENNFRRDHWPLYKKHRDNFKKPDSMPYALEEIYEQSPRAVCVDRLEADDLIGMMVSSGKAIGVTVDKDLRQVPGWHWNPDKEREPTLLSRWKADKFFFNQWMAGDSTDNIWGLWRVGPKKAEKFLDKVHKDWEDEEVEVAIDGIYTREWDETVWEKAVMNMYIEEDWDKRPENRTPDSSREEYAIAQARCVRILREGDYNEKSNEISLWSPYE